MQIRERPSISPSTSIHVLDSYSIVPVDESRPTGHQTAGRLDYAQLRPNARSWGQRLKEKLENLEWKSAVVGLIPSIKSIVIGSVLTLFLIVILRPVYRYFAIAPFTDPDRTNFHPPPRFQGLEKLNTKMLVVVISAADDTTQRRLIRNDWAHRSKARNTTHLVFLVGLSRGNRTDLKTEQLLFRDLVLTSVVENYYNLSLKTLSALLFARTHYSRTKCVVKVDSDNVLHIPNLEDLCDSFRGESRTSEFELNDAVSEEDELIVGHCEDGTPVIREWQSKWRIPRFVYSEDTYPLYCFGETYLFVGRGVPNKLLAQLDAYGFSYSENSRKMPEDLIFSGFLAAKAGIERRNVAGFALQRQDSRFGCLGGRPRAYSYHLIGEKRNFAKAHLLMSKTNRTSCADE